MLLLSGVLASADAGSRIEELMRQRRLAREGKIPSVGVAAAAAALEEPGGAPVKVPRPQRRRFKSLRITLDSVPDRLEEDQAASNPDAFLTVGRKVETSVSFLPGGELRQNTAEAAEAAGFFLSQPALHIYSVDITVMSYKGTGDLQTRGSTPPVGRLEILRVREVGDIRGESVHVQEGIRFVLGGKATHVPIGIDTDPKGRYFFVLTVPSEEGKESFVSVAAATEGDFQALRLDPKHHLPLKGKKLKNAAVNIAYRPDPSAVRPSTAVTGEFLASLTQFLREHPDAVGIPLRLELE